ncbi:J domain-containing protein [Paenibacillus cymbidii]|uniref:J domain-containing protein n=1 Tax=Paenibacillus cymbidii TaxID=1639034 RepID=UPI0010809B3F|nr:DnaJ domain-containing protein [Paenibacillus cymbidii]
MESIETAKRKRGRKSKPKLENHYKTLGLRANATQQSIRQSYVSLVKQHPPETHPEEFQAIRRAYDTLRDPAKRLEYDMMRKYGDKLDGIMNEAMEHIGEQRFEKAAPLLERAIQIAPDNAAVRFVCALHALLQEDLDKAQLHWNHSYERFASEEEKVGLLGAKASLLLEQNYPQQALETIEFARQQHPSHTHRMASLSAAVYRELGREQEAWETISRSIPDPEAYRPEHLQRFIDWINIMIDLEKWSYWGQLQAKVRKFLRTFTDEEEKEDIIASLMEECAEYEEVRRFREAELFAELAYLVNPKDPDLQARRRDLQHMARIEKELDRMDRDEELFPLVGLKAHGWFQSECGDMEGAEQIEDMINQLQRSLDQIDEAYASGISRLKRKYPLVYNRYKKDWDKLFEESTAGMNREMRRQFR